MTLQESVDFFSKPREKSIIMSFDSIEDMRIIVNDIKTSIPAMLWRGWSFPEELSGFYTEVEIMFVNENTLLQKTVVLQLKDLPIYYPSLAPADGYRIEVDSDWIYVARNENNDILYLSKRHPQPGWYLYYLSAHANAESFDLNNFQIVQESLSIEDSLCASDNELHFGRCEAKQLNITVVCESDTLLKGRWFETSLYVDAPNVYLIDDEGNRIVDDGGNYITTYKKGNVEEFALGRFKVFSDERSNDRSTRELTCYDALYDINNKNVRTWLDGLSFPMTLKNFRDSFFNYLDIPQVETTLINDSFSVKGQFGDDPLILGQTIIEAICELNGVFGRMTSDGEFEYVSLTREEEVTYPYYVNDSGSFEDYVTDYITGVGIVKEDESISAIYVGSFVNAYYLVDNPILHGSEDLNTTRQALENLYNKIRDVSSYRPFTISTFGDPVLPVGTSVVFETKNKTIRSIVMSKSLSGIQSMKDNIEAYGEKKLERNYN